MMAGTDERASARAYVSKLFETRDGYLLLHGTDKIRDKPKIVEAELQKTLEKINSVDGDDTTDPELIFLKGKSLNVLSSYQKECETLLAKAVKLDPQNIDAWNQLGECFWKKGDKDQAHTCFKGALDVQENKESLQSLSMLLRQLDVSSEIERYNNITESLDIAKQALKLDLKDGKSWFILGNAYLALFFSRMENVEDVRHALQAYKRAEVDKREAVNNPDLHYNRSSVHEYQGDYNLAVEGYVLASLLDPDWQDPKDAIDRIKERSREIVSHIEARGKIKGKKLASHVAALNDKAQSPPSLSVAELKDGLNPDTLCMVSVIKIFSTEKPPQMFLVTDKNSELFCLSIYNMVSNKIFAGDTIVIPEPFKHQVKVTFPKEENGTDVETCQYTSIRVDNPVTLRVNDKALGESSLVKSALSITVKSE
eukprot:m.339700 g.339700  ORF g.339700 m.339700 type:complete len:425 (+) comp18917_c0_seq1:187-1461(+)